MNVRQSKIAAGVSEGELLVVEAEAMEHRGVEVVDADGFFNGFESDVVCGSVKLITN